MSGQSEVGVYGSTTTAATATSLAGGTTGAEPYQSASGVTSFAYPSSSTASFYLDGTRTDSYTPNGTALLPYTTLAQLVTGVASATGPFVIYSTPTAAGYTYTGNVSFPAQFMTIYGNESQWTITGNITVNAGFEIYNLNTTATGTLTYAATSTVESERNGGSLTITGGIFTSGYEHFFALSILLNTLVTLNVGATPVFTNVVGTPRFASASGATAATVLTIIDCQSLATGAYTNVNMSNGGLTVIRGFIATNNNLQANINLSGSSGTSATVANLLAGVSAAIVTCGTAYTYIDNGSLIASLTGSNLLTPNGLGMSAPAAIAVTVKSGTTGAATFDSGTTGTVNIGTSANAKTVAIGNSTSGSKVNIFGEIDGVATAAGYIGQPLSSLIASGSAVSLTTATPANVTSIALTAGDWDVMGEITFVATSATVVASAVWEGGINSTTAVLPTDGTETFHAMPLAIATTSFNATVTIPRKIFNSASAVTTYLVAEATFTAGTVAAYGNITARRVH